jgi:hypothetical protein
MSDFEAEVKHRKWRSRSVVFTYFKIHVYVHRQPIISDLRSVIIVSGDILGKQILKKIENVYRFEIISVKLSYTMFYTQLVW